MYPTCIDRPPATKGISRSLRAAAFLLTFGAFACSGTNPQSAVGSSISGTCNGVPAGTLCPYLDTTTAAYYQAPYVPGVCELGTCVRAPLTVDAVCNFYFPPAPQPSSPPPPPNVAGGGPPYAQSTCDWSCILQWEEDAHVPINPFPLPDVNATPLVLNLCNRSISFLGHGVPFDIAGNESRTLDDWISPSLPFLALPDQAGNLTSGAQLFGTGTALKTGGSAMNGFLALAQYDDNHDGQIDSNDAVFAKLVLWFDLNSNGRAESWERLPLSQAGVESISLAYAAESPPSTSVSYVGFDGSMTYGDGSRGEVADVYFASECAGIWFKCGNGCVNPYVDSNNCGSCGNVCPQGQQCSSGWCASPVPPGPPAESSDCGNGDVNTQTDVENCGGCGVVCPGAYDGTATCSNGVCGSANTNQCIYCDCDGATYAFCTETERGCAALCADGS